MSRPKPPAVRKTKVFLVDDHALLREGLRYIIDQQPDLTVCGQAGSAAEALPAIARAQPDVIVADISMPGRDGLELIKEIMARNRHALVLVLSMHDETLYAERVLRAGARGYVMKNAPQAEFLQAIRRVGAGEFVLGRQVIGQMAARTAAGARPEAALPVECLTDRELEVYRLLGQGRTRAEIARQLKLSPKTVETHRVNIREKLGVRTATELRQHAMEFLREEAAGLHHG
jgi:DNA-binding NarL/FixJ family response regulator